MRPPLFLLPRPARQLTDERLALRGEVAQHLLGLSDGIERMQSIAAAAHLPRRLRTAQKQQRQQRFLATVDVPQRVEVVIEAHRAPAHHAPDELLVLQAIERAIDIALAQLHHRLAIRFLIARRDERVERQRVVLRRRQLLFHEGAEDAELDGVEGAREMRAGFRVVERRDVAHERNWKLKIEN